MAGVWILAENAEQSKELLNIGQELAAQIGTGLMAWAWEAEWADQCAACGANEVYLLPALAPQQSIDAYLPVIFGKMQESMPDVFLFVATLKGKELASRIAGRFNAGLVSECQNLRWDDAKNSLLAERLVYGGAGVQTVSFLERPQIATIPPRAFDPALPQEGSKGQITILGDQPTSPVQVLERKAREHQSRDITKARVVICIGRGMEKEEDIEKARELAGLLGGELGCTRPIAEELHWLPEDTCIGLSGKTVKPDLYIGLGVSGQIQHLTGIRDARVVCAVNCDENAPVFAAADYGIVGDVNQVLPQLIGEIKAIKEK